MKAVIMAGGKGTRLASVLKDIPKPMVAMAGRPLLEYQIDNLKENGVTDIILVVGHLGNVIKDHFGNGEKYGVRISYYEEKEPLGTAGALYYLKRELTEDFTLLFGDLFVNINFMRFYDYHIKKRAHITLYTHPNSHPYDSDIIVSNDDGRVIGWSNKNSVREKDYKNQVNAGVYIISPKIIEWIEENKKTDLEKDIITQIIPQEIVYAYSCTEYVKDIGTPERLKKVEADFRNGICEKRNLKSKQKCIFLDRDGTINKYVGFLKSAELMELEENVTDAIRKINESEYLAVVVSNQPVIARGECTYEELEAIHNKMHMLLGEDGAYVDDLYYCPHHPDKGFEGEVKSLKIKCSCRKPEIGMILQAAEEHNIDLNNSWMIGDMTIDIQTGINAGMRTILVETGVAGLDGKFRVKPDYCARNLCEAIKTIMSLERR
ncbi:MAG: HAD-IIIA family hydrolase [Lachnospiraceae bacterium]